MCRSVNKPFIKGQKAFDIRSGWGVVFEIKPKGKYPVCVRFLSETIEYTLEGKSYEDDIVSMLKHEEYRFCDLVKNVQDEQKTRNA